MLASKLYDLKIAESLVYANLAKQLCNKLGETFSQLNGPLVYQLQKELTDLS